MKATEIIKKFKEVLLSAETEEETPVQEELSAEVTEEVEEEQEELAQEETVEENSAKELAEENEYEEDKKDFYRRHDRDTHFNFKETVKCDVKMTPSLVYGLFIPPYMRLSYFVLAALICLTYPYQVWVTTYSEKQKVQLFKTIRRFKE